MTSSGTMLLLDYGTTGLQDNWITGLQDCGTTGQQTARPKAEDEETRNSSNDFAKFSGFLLYRLDQAMQATKDPLHVSGQHVIFRVREVAESVGQMDEILRLSKRSPRDVQEMEIIPLR